MAQVNGHRPLPAVVIPHPHVALDERGVPVIVGTKILVHRLWSWHRQGTPMDTIFRRYPQLGPARVLDAMAFAYDNLDLVTASIALEREDAAQAAAQLLREEDK